jgi:hypothetical protein
MELQWYKEGGGSGNMIASGRNENVERFGPALMECPSKIEQRDAKDYAIEFGEYLAKRAEEFREFVNINSTVRQSAQDEMNDRWSALTGAIYEFRKRAAKVGRPISK